MMLGIFGISDMKTYYNVLSGFDKIPDKTKSDTQQMLFFKIYTNPKTGISQVTKLQYKEFMNSTQIYMAWKDEVRHLALLTNTPEDERVFLKLQGVHHTLVRDEKLISAFRRASITLYPVPIFETAT